MLLVLADAAAAQSTTTQPPRATQPMAGAPVAGPRPMQAAPVPAAAAPAANMTPGVVPALLPAGARVDAIRTVFARGALERRFQITPAEQERFALGVTSPGVITADASWQGARVTISLRHEATQQVLAKVAGNAPGARLQYSVTPADVQRGGFYTIAVTSAGAAGGIVKATFPQPDVARLEAEAAKIMAARTTAATTKAPALSPNFQAKLAAAAQGFQQARATALIDWNKNVEAKAKANLQRRVDLVTPPGLTRIPGTNAVRLPGKPATVQQVPQAAKSGGTTMLRITFVSPPSGTPPGTVDITLENDTTNGQKRFWFTIGQKTLPGSNVPAPITLPVSAWRSTSPAGNNYYRVTLPCDPAASEPFAGSVFVEDIGAGTSPAVPLSYTPPPLPRFDTKQALVGSSREWIEVQGSNLAPGNGVSLVLADGTEKSLTYNLVTSTLIKVQLPTYSSRDDQTAYMSVSYGSDTSWGFRRFDEAVLVRLRATIPTITSIETEPGGASPGSQITIHGVGLQKPYEVLVLLPNASSFASVIDLFSDDRQVVARMPDFGAVSGPTTTQVYMRTSLNSTPTQTAFVQMPIKPKYVTGWLQVKEGDGHFFGDSRLLHGDSDRYQFRGDYFVVSHEAGLFTGSKGDDEYFLTRQLKNGWIVTEMFFEYHGSNDCAAASVVESRPNTTSPYVKVHWWNNAVSCSASYSLWWAIKGPSGFFYE
jgi:hypothetical protein